MVGVGELIVIVIIKEVVLLINVTFKRTQRE